MVPSSLPMLKSRYDENWVSVYQGIAGKLQETLDHVASQKKLTEGEVPPPKHAFLEPVVKGLIDKLSIKNPEQRSRKKKRGQVKCTLRHLVHITDPTWRGRSALQRIRTCVKALFLRHAGLVLDFNKLRHSLEQVEYKMQAIQEILSRDHDRKLIDRFVPRDAVSAHLQNVAKRLASATSLLTAPDDLLDLDEEQGEACDAMVKRPEDLSAWHVASIIQVHRIFRPQRRLYRSSVIELARRQKMIEVIQTLPITRTLRKDLLGGEYTGATLRFVEERIRILDPKWKDGEHCSCLEQGILRVTALYHCPPENLLMTAFSFSSLATKTGVIFDDEQKIWKGLESKLSAQEIASLLSGLEGACPTERLDALIRTLIPFTAWNEEEVKGRIYHIAAQLALRICGIYRFAQIAALVVRERRILHALRGCFLDKLSVPPSGFAEGNTLRERLQGYWADPHRLSAERISAGRTTKIDAEAAVILRFAERAGAISTIALVLQGYQGANYRDATKRGEAELFEEIESFYQHVTYCLERPLFRVIVAILSPRLLHWLQGKKVAQFLQSSVRSGRFKGWNLDYDDQLILGVLDEGKQKERYGSLADTWGHSIGVLRGSFAFAGFACQIPDSSKKHLFEEPPPHSILEGLAEKYAPASSAVRLRSVLNEISQSALGSLSGGRGILRERGIDVCERVETLLSEGVSLSISLRKALLDVQAGVSLGAMVFREKYENAQLLLALPEIKKIFSRHFRPMTDLVEDEQMASAVQKRGHAMLTTLVFAGEGAVGALLAPEHGEYLERIRRFSEQGIGL